MELQSARSAVFIAPSLSVQEESQNNKSNIDKPLIILFIICLKIYVGNLAIYKNRKKNITLIFAEGQKLVIRFIYLLKYEYGKIIKGHCYERRL